MAAKYSLKLYEYHHVDGKGPFIKFDDHVKRLNIPALEARRFRETLLSEFSEMGWEGDGELEAGFVPAGMLCNATSGTMYHVKQRNNGTSYIASVPKLEEDGIASVEPHGRSKLYALTKRDKND